MRVQISLAVPKVLLDKQPQQVYTKYDNVRIKMHVTIATPMYGGQCSGGFTKSLIRTLSELSKEGIQTSFIDLYNESLITRARNTLTNMFLKSDSDYLLFIDADQTFRAQDIIRMIKHDKEMVGAPVPMKAINWDKVRLAALAEKQNLEQFSGIYNINFLPSVADKDTRISLSEPLEVLYVGTGMLLIKREVFEKLSDSVQEYVYDGSTMPAYDLVSGTTKVKNFWETAVVDQRLLSEDYNFCSMWRSIGGKVYVDLLAKVTHFGTYAFSGSIIDPDTVQKVEDKPKTKAKKK